MISEQSNDRLLIVEEEGRHTIQIWLMLILGIGIVASSLYCMSLPLWATLRNWRVLPLLVALSGVSVVIIVLGGSLIMSFEPKSLIFDRLTDEFTVFHHIRVFGWKIEWKKVYPLQDIKGVRLITILEDDKEISGYSVSLVIQRRETTIYSWKDKHLSLPVGEGDDYLCTNENFANRVASFLELSVEREIRKTFSPTYYP